MGNKNQWNKTQLMVALLLTNGYEPQKIMDELHVSKTLVYKIKKRLEDGDNPPELTPENIAKAPLAMPFGNDNEADPSEVKSNAVVAGVIQSGVLINDPLNNDNKAKKNDDPAPLKKENKIAKLPSSKTTNNINEAIGLIMEQKFYQISLTPQVLLSFKYAKIMGFEGDMAQWLNLVSEDFWLGRNINFYEGVVGKTTSAPVNKSNQ